MFVWGDKMGRSGIKGFQGFPTLGPNQCTIRDDGGVAIDLGDVVAIVDAADYELVAPFRWYLDSGGYVATSDKQIGPIRMHRLLMGLRKGFKPMIDHANHNTTDNRRGNLRLVHGNGNVGNMHKPPHGVLSIYKGVSVSGDKWRAYIKIQRRQFNLGSYESEILAARAYDAGAIAVFGEFALLNFPTSRPDEETILDAHARLTAERKVPTSKFPGVDFVKVSKKWRARIREHGKEIGLGCFATEAQAAEAVHLALLKVNKQPH